MLPGRQPLQYNLCVNKIDFLQLADSEFKPNWSLLLLQAVSFAIHIFVNAKIKILKVQQKRTANVLTFSDQMKFGDIMSMDNRSISDYLTSFLSVSAASSFVITTTGTSRKNPIEFNKVTVHIVTKWKPLKVITLGPS
jgi:hypothetical protein